MGKKRKKRISLAGPGYEGTREMQTINLPDPVQPGLYAKAAVNIRASGIRHMMKNGGLDPHQAEAGFRLERTFQRAGIGNTGAIDYSKTKVDGGQLNDPLTDSVVEAIRELNAIAAFRGIGIMGFRILQLVCGEGKLMTEVAAIISPEFGKKGNSIKGYVAGRLQEALNELAAFYGIEAKATGRSRSRILTATDIVSAGGSEWEIGTGGQMVEKVR